MKFCIIKSSRAGMEDYGSISARYRSGSINKKYAIGFIMKFSDWDLYNNGKYDSEKIIPNLNISFGKFANILEQIKNYFDNDFNPDKVAEEIKTIREAMLKEVSDNCPQRSRIASPLLLVDHMERIRAEFASGRRTKENSTKPISQSLIDNYRTAINNVKEFENVCGCRFSLNDIDMHFRDDLLKWNLERGLCQNTLNGYFSSILTCMRIALEEGLTKQTDFLDKDFVPKNELVEEVYVNTAQLDALYKLDLSDIKSNIEAIGKFEMNDIDRKSFKERLSSHRRNAFDQIRDVFIVGCLTGQRFSDFSRINKGMIKRIKGSSFVVLTQEKTEKIVSIPLDKRVKAILEKYNGVLPKIHIRFFNLGVRLLGELLGWTWEPHFDGNNLGYKKGSRFCDMLSSHTARRSFATNAYAAGVPLQSIMTVTGHSREERLKTYLRLQDQEKGIIAANAFAKIIEIKREA